jgi:hypothetical protein
MVITRFITIGAILSFILIIKTQLLKLILKIVSKSDRL